MPAQEMGLFPPEIWKKRTALRLSSRSGSTLKVDQAYKAYYDNRGQEQAYQLYLALEAYLTEKGSSWDLCERDKVSGGLMRYIHAFVKKSAAGRLPPILVGTRQEQQLAAGRNALQNTDIPHSRYGVLYLFGNMTVDSDTFKIGMEGLGAVGGSVAHAFGDGHEVNEFMKFKIKSNDYITGGAAVTKSAGKIRDTLGMRGSYKAGGVEVKGEALAPRALYLQKGSDAWNHGASWTHTENAINARDGHGATYNTLRIAGAAALEAMNNLRIIIMNALRNLVDWIRAKLVGKGREIATISGMAVHALLEKIAKHVLAEAVPVMGMIKDLAGGISKTFTAAKQSIGAWMERRQISINPGHPELAARSIESAMQQGIFEGLIDMLKGGAKIAAAAFLPGLHLLINAVMAGVEFLVRFLMRRSEVGRIAAWLVEAREVFAKERALAIKKRDAADRQDLGRRLAMEPDTRNIDTIGAKHLEPELDASKGGIIHNLDEFKAFYQRGCEASPLIPIMTLNTGICGSLMVMLNMFKDTHQPQMVSQDKFDIGTAYFARLKDYGRAYIGKSGIDFQSADRSVRQLIEHAKTHHGRPMSTLDKGVAFATGVLGAGP